VLCICTAELQINTDSEVFSILHGECHFKSSSTPGTGGLAGRFKGYQDVGYIVQNGT